MSKSFLFPLMALSAIFFAACGEDSTNNSNNSEQAACSVSKNDDGESYTLKCLDGTEVVIHDGKDGERGADGSDGKDGEKGSDGKNGQNGSDGKNGTDGKNGEDGNDGKNGSDGKNGDDGVAGISGEGCSVKSNDDGSFALTCPDGTNIVFNADGKVSQITKDSTDITPKLSSSSGKVPEPAEGSSSSAKTDGKSSSSKKTGVQPQGFVQFNADVYGSTVGNSIYLYDEDNASQTAKVLVRSIEAADTITVTLDRHDLYFYAPFQMSIYGGNGSVLRVAKTDFIVVEYKDPSTGVTEIDGATVALSSSNTVSLSFGRKTYSDTLDKAVITLVDSSLTADVVVTVKVTTPVDTTDIPLYPVEGGDGTTHIGFVGFTMGEPLEGEVKIKSAGNVITAFYGSVSAETKLSGFFGVDFNGYGSMTDPRDGKSYKTVKIGTQTWMAENLNYEMSNSYCNSDSCKVYGRYYTWAAAMKACPKGWHLPASTEWTSLYETLGKDYTSMQMIGYEQWPDATNASGFSALPVGYYSHGNFNYVGSLASFWSATEYDSIRAYLWDLNAGDAYLNGGYEDIGSAVRCLQDSK